MKTSKLRTVLVPLGLFVLSAGAYWSVLTGTVNFAPATPLIFAAITGATALGALIIEARAPAVTAGVATLGFSLAAASGDRMLITGNSAVFGAAILATLGVLSYAVSMAYHIGTRIHSVSSI